MQIVDVFFQTNKKEKGILYMLFILLVYYFCNGVHRSHASSSFMIATSRIAGQLCVHDDYVVRNDHFITDIIIHIIYL